eukprot:CFRG7963T1
MIKVAPAVLTGRSLRHCLRAVTGCISSHRRSFSVFQGNMPILGKVAPPAGGLKFNNLLIVTKLSRFAYEKIQHPEMCEEELSKSLSRRGSMYKTLKVRHDIHQEYVDTMVDILTRNGCSVKLISVGDLTEEHVVGMDVVLSAGGDGTFLSTASMVKGNHVPLIGINTDPERSQGHLCLKNESYRPEGFSKILHKLMRGEFSWKRRSRIRIIVVDNVTKTPRTLNKLALNDVLFTERDSARATYYQLTIDGDRGNREKQKASSMLICTGTGSTAWMYTMNRLWLEESSALVDMMKQLNPPAETKEWLENIDIAELTQTYNSKIVFPSGDTRMQYSVREPVCNGIFFTGNRHGFANTVAMKSRSLDAEMVLDGAYSHPWCDGDEALLSIHDEDALLTVELKERSIAA